MINSAQITALVEVALDREDMALPPSVKWNQTMGFCLFMMKAVINKLRFGLEVTQNGD
ncbi:MAG: hypothetical protein ABSF53_19680 [Terracidiphilus sp.]|jgi:hypothetical protein